MSSLVGMPAERPICESCGKPLPYVSEVLEATRVETGKKYFDGSDETRRVVLRRQWIRWTGYPLVEPMFCTLRCALEFGVRVVRQRRIAGIVEADRRRAGG